MRPSALIGLALIIIIAGLALFAPFAAPEDPYHTQWERSLRSPTWENPFGADNLGRDLLSRVIYGGRRTLLVGSAAVSIGFLAGSLIGLIAGVARRRVDAILSRSMDIMLAFPAVLLALVIMAGLGPSLANATLAVGLVYIPRFARLARAAVLVESAKEYVLAARSTGCGTVRLYLRHLLPNCLAPLLVLATLSLGTAILEIAALSFLGLGAQPPSPEWGAMLSEGRRYLQTAPHVAFFPGLALGITVFAISLLGDSLRDSLDPKLRPR